MGEERIVAEDIHGGSYPVVKKGKEDDSFYHGKLEHGTLIENHGDDRTIFTKAAPFLIASWIVLLVHEFSYLQAAPELSTPLQSISKYFPNLDPDRKNHNIFFAILATSAATYLCLAVFIFLKFCRQSALITTLFISISIIGPCGALLGANPNEIQMLLMPLVLNTAFTTTLLQKRRLPE